MTLIVVAIAGVRFRAHAEPGTSEHRTQPSNVRSLAQQGSLASPGTTPTEHLEAELIVARPNGFEPSEIKRTPGPFLLIIENRSGIDLGPLRLEGEDSTQPTPVSRVAQAQITREQQSYAERVDLPMGRYRLHQTASLAVPQSIRQKEWEEHNLLL